jgi:hypothetical protein
MIHGKVTVTKIYKNGFSEKVFEEENTILRGFGYTMASILSGDPGSIRNNYFFRYFQLGKGNALSSVPDGDRLGVWGLAQPFSKSEYGTAPTLPITKLYPISGTPKGSPIEFTSFSTSTAQYFGDITGDSITQVTDNSIHHQIVLDETVANETSIREIGLYACNPNTTPTRDNPILVAYKKFPPAGIIEKNSNFSFILDWEITIDDISSI